MSPRYNLIAGIIMIVGSLFILIVSLMLGPGINTITGIILLVFGIIRVNKSAQTPKELSNINSYCDCDNYALRRSSKLFAIAQHSSFRLSCESYSPALRLQIHTKDVTPLLVDLLR